MKSPIIGHLEGIQSSPQSSDTAMESLSDSGMSQRVPKCARCRCHGINCELKGHKEKCQFKDCQCRSCLLVVERQKITATRVAHLRHQRKIDKQRNNGYYNAYTGLTEEEEFVLTRYVDGPEEKYKHRAIGCDYDYVDGRPYKVPQVRYNSYQTFPNMPKPYPNYFPAGTWDYHRGNRLSPCTRECCVPWRERSFPESHIPSRNNYAEGLSDIKMTGRLVMSPRVQGHIMDERRHQNEAFQPPVHYRGEYRDQRTQGYDEQKNSQKMHGVEHSNDAEEKQRNGREADIEIDVERVYPEEGDEQIPSLIKDEAVRIKTERNEDENGEIDELSNTGKESMGQKLNKKSNLACHYDEYSDKESESIERAKEEQRKRRDEFIRSKCGEVLSVMFPDFDGKIIRQIAEKTDYDIQKSVEQLLEIKKQARSHQNKSAFFSYNETASPHGVRPSCKCCAFRPTPVAPLKPRCFEVRKRDWVEVGGRDVSKHDRPEEKRPHLE